MCELDISWELIIVDDGSTDKTAELVKKVPFKNLHLLILSENQGKGAAVCAGVRASRASWVLFTDADNSTPIEEVAQFLPNMLDGQSDIICGSRALPESTVEEKSGLRQIATKALSTLVQLGLQLPVKDSQCGFKAMKTEAALSLLRYQQIKGFSFDMELLYLAKKLGYKIAERPVHWVDAPGSKVEPLKEALRFLGAIRFIRRQHGHLKQASRMSQASPIHSHPLPIQLLSKTQGIRQNIGMLERTNLIGELRKTERPQTLIGGISA